jgi:aminoacrylate hydrolase
MLHHESFGSPDRDCVLMSAGLGGAGAFWRPQIAALAEHFHVVVYDQRGTGGSREPLPEGYSIDAMADDVVEILDARGIGRCHFVGHALGGIVGLKLAARTPARVSKLVPVNAWGSADSHTARCFDMRLALLRHVGVEAYVNAQPIFLYSAAWLSANAEAVTAEVQHGIAHFQGADTIQKRIAALLAFDMVDELRRITHPTLVVASRDDVLVPWTASQRLVDTMPNARLWMVESGGHGFTATAPEAFNAELIAFLRG